MIDYKLSGLILFAMESRVFSMVFASVPSLVPNRSSNPIPFVPSRELMSILLISRLILKLSGMKRSSN